MMHDKPLQDDGGNAPAIGARRQFYFNDAGQPAYRDDALSAEDFLNPQPGDEFQHGAMHDEVARIAASMLHHHFRYSPTTSVHIRPKLIWPDASLAQPMPDVVIVNNLPDQHTQRKVLDLAAEQRATSEQVSIRAIFEVTSPWLAEYDLEAKRTIYARAGVPEYWVLDTGLRPDRSTPNFAIYGYQLVDGHYAAVAQTASGRFESKACRLWLAVDPAQQIFQIGDLRTGKALPLPSTDDDPSISSQAEANRRAQSIAGQLKL